MLRSVSVLEEGLNSDVEADAKQMGLCHRVGSTLCNAVFVAVTAIYSGTLFYLGAARMDSCPWEPKVPIYATGILIPRKFTLYIIDMRRLGSGILGLTLTALQVSRKGTADEATRARLKLASGVATTLITMWNVFGSFAVYGAYEPHFNVNESNPRFCRADVYLASIAAVTLVNGFAALVGALFLLAGCFACGDLLLEVRRQRRMRKERAGVAPSTSSAATPDAGDEEVADWEAMRRILKSPPSYEEAVAKAK